MRAPGVVTVRSSPAYAMHGWHGRPIYTRNQVAGQGGSGSLFTATSFYVGNWSLLDGTTRGARVIMVASWSTRTYSAHASPATQVNYLIDIEMQMLSIDSGQPAGARVR